MSISRQAWGSYLANRMLGRKLPVDSKVRLDGLRTMPALNGFLNRQAQGAGAVLGLQDSTGFSPGTTDGSAIGAAGGEARWFDKLAINVAAAYPSITHRLHVFDDYARGVTPRPMIFQTPRELNVAGGGYVKATLPGTSQSTFYYPWSVGDDLGSQFFVGMKVTPASWTPAADSTLFSLNSTGNINFQWALRTNGNLAVRWIPSGGTLSAFKESTATPGTPAWVGVSVVGSTGVITFWTSADGRNWTQLGTTVTNAGKTFTSLAQSTGMRYEIGSSSNGGVSMLAGDVYEVHVRQAGVTDGNSNALAPYQGPTILPTQIQQWYPDASVHLFSSYGPQLDWINASWPGQGLDAFDDVVNLPLLVPHYPYLTVIVSTSHNDGVYTDRALVKKWDSLLARIEGRIPEAEVLICTQNPTLRTDIPQADHTRRITQLEAYAQSRGLGILNTYDTFGDWTGGAGLADLLAANGTQTIHPTGPGVTRQASKAWDEGVA